MTQDCLHALRHRLWKAPQAIFTMSVAPATLLGDLSTFMEKSPHGSPHVHTCNWPVHFCIDLCSCHQVRPASGIPGMHSQPDI